MSLIYLTADRFTPLTGGGRVVTEERAALCTLGFVHTVQPRGDLRDPFQQDEDCFQQLSGLALHTDPAPRLCHAYAGCFTRSIAYLKSIGYRVCYTVAAHDVHVSRQSHLDLGLPFSYEHLNDPTLFSRYIAAYRDLADVVVVPGRAPLTTVLRQGRTRRTEVIPHGCDVPREWSPPEGDPFVVGYLGSPGADKGLLTLACAWKQFRQACDFPARLLVGGQAGLARPFCDLPDVDYRGWYDDVSDFYRGVSLYVQPSNTEGFGIEVVEAMARGRPVLCSTGAGAADTVPEAWTFAPGDYEELAKKLDLAAHVIRPRCGGSAGGPEWFAQWRARGEEYAWDKIRPRYVALWKELLAGQ